MTAPRPPSPRLFAVLLASLALTACHRKDPSKELIPETTAPAQSPSVTAPGAVLPDGKYERVTVEGVVVPMINVMNNGAVVLVDTDGAKPRTWEEQYKRKGNLPDGTFNIHKTNVNKNDTFEDDPIDREGLWAIDAKGNITKR